MAQPMSSEQFDELLELLRRSRGFDFGGYKRSTLSRRITNRMTTLGIDDFGTYIDHLETNPDEYRSLFDSILINVTGFFRDEAAWDLLRDSVLPDLVGRAIGNWPLRIWSAGCATGEEAYSLAMLLAEKIGVDRFRERVKIYATDVDEEALQQARTAVYSAKDLEPVPEELRQKYFEPYGTQFAFRSDLRRSVIFGRNDLTQDAPISRVDLLVSRNTLMYFNAETQERILRRFHFSVKNAGYLFLGRAEMLLTHGDLFAPVDLPRRVFRKVPAASPGEAAAAALSMSSPPTPVQGHLTTAALDASPIAHVVVDDKGVLAVANTCAESMFNVHRRDIGRPFKDLELSYRPIELRSLIEQVVRDRRPVERTEVGWQRGPGAEMTYLDVQVAPLLDHASSVLGVSIGIIDVTHRRKLKKELEDASRDLTRAYGELQSTNEELETTNEELQSTNEELETTNEELQSTVEELETMNEELQSTNDEQQQINQALRLRSDELDRVRTFVDTMINSLGAAAVIVDTDLQVMAWSPGAAELWGMRTDEAVGRHFLTLDIGLPVDELAPTVREVIGGAGRAARPVKVDAVNRRGRALRVSVTITGLADSDEARRGAMIIIEPVDGPGMP